MLIPDFVDRVKEECFPVELATPDPTIAMMVQNAIRYWNIHSAFKIVRMYEATPSIVTVQLDTDFKNVVRVLPATQPDWILQNYPLWTLLGITVVDNITNDLILLAEGYKNYRYYLGTDFKFQFEKSDDPSIGGKLYLSNLPSQTTRIAVVGCKRITETEDIQSEYIIDWILKYSKALTLLTEGMTLRKTDAIGIRNDGDAMIKEQQEIIKDLKEELYRDGRWFGFLKRF